MSGGSITAVAEELIEPSTELLAEDSGFVADPAGGVAFGGLVELVRSGAIAAGERVVLVVTGGGAAGNGGTAYRAHEIDADADHFLAALGVGRG